MTRKEYDVIFMDLQMPGMSGIEATVRIRQSLAGKRLPHIIAMTASVFEEDRDACREAGMLDFVGKPIDLAHVEAVLSRVSRERGGSRAIVTLSKGPLEALRHLESSGAPGFLADLCRDFAADARERLGGMAEALRRTEPQEIERQAHALRSSSATLGASEMSDLCGRIEDAARRGHLSGLGEWIDALSLSLVRVEDALARELEGGARAGEA